MKILTMKEFYLHPKAQAALGGREIPMLLQLLTLVIGPFLARPKPDMEASRSALQGWDRVETMKARARFERGGFA